MENTEYLKPSDIKELLLLMAENKDRATVIAGGTNLIPEMRNGVRRPQVLVDVSDLQELTGIQLDKDRLTIGAATTIAAIAASPVIREHVPILSKAAGELGNPLTRNRATIGGNLANASPCADTAPPLLALEATVHIADDGGKERTVPMDKFFMGYKLTRLGRGDVMTRITLSLPHRKGQRRPHQVGTAQSRQHLRGQCGPHAVKRKWPHRQGSHCLWFRRTSTHPRLRPGSVA